MGNRDANQEVINRLSLVMTIHEDVAKTCKAVGTHPKMTELLLRFHSQHMEMEKSINNIREQQLAMAKLIDQIIDSTTAAVHMVNDLDKHVGFSENETVKSEEINKE